MKNWSIATGREGYAITATAVSSVTNIKQGGAIEQAGTDVMIDNPGPLDVYVQAWDKASADANLAVATLRGVRVPANSLQPYFVGDRTHLAVITASGTQPIVVHVGDGV